MRKLFRARGRMGNPALLLCQTSWGMTIARRRSPNQRWMRFSSFGKTEPTFRHSANFGFNSKKACISDHLWKEEKYIAGLTAFKHQLLYFTVHSLNWLIDWFGRSHWTNDFTSLCLFVCLIHWHEISTSLYWFYQFHDLSWISSGVRASDEEEVSFECTETWIQICLGVAAWNGYEKKNNLAKTE